MGQSTRYFHFDDGPDGFEFPVDDPNGYSMAWDEAMGALRVDYLFDPSASGVIPITETSYMKWVGTWEDLNVPPGATVEAVRIASEASMLAENYNAEGTNDVTIGTIELWESVGSTKHFTLLPARTTSIVDSEYVIASGLPDIVSGPPLSDSDHEIEIRIYTTVDPGYPFKLFHDDLTIVTTHDGINSGVVEDAPLNLFLQCTGIGEVDNAIDLFIKSEGEEAESNTLNLYLRQMGTGPGGPGTGTGTGPGLPPGSTAGGAVCTLFINGQIPNVYDINSNVDLSVAGHSSASGIARLLIYMDTLLADSIPLYISGPQAINGEATLFLKAGADINRSMNLFLKGQNYPLASEQLSLFTYGSPPGAPWWMPNIAGTLISSSVNLYLEANGEFLDPESIPLYWNDLNLFLKANIETPGPDPEPEGDIVNVAVGYRRLFIKGAGFAPGYYPVNHQMNLFLEGS